MLYSREGQPKDCVCFSPKLKEEEKVKTIKRVIIACMIFRTVYSFLSIEMCKLLSSLLKALVAWKQSLSTHTFAFSFSLCAQSASWLDTLTQPQP